MSNNTNLIAVPSHVAQALAAEAAQRQPSGPTVTMERIYDVIVAEHYYVVPGTTMTVCCLTLLNGFNVIGSSACADPGNFDEELGRNIAFRDATNQIWKLEGYLLKQWLYLEAQPLENEEATGNV